MCASVAEEDETIEVLVDVLQMFRDINPIFCLASEILTRLIQSSDIIRAQVSE